MFLRVQQVVIEKDKIIDKLRSRSTAKDQCFVSSFNLLRSEL